MADKLSVTIALEGGKEIEQQLKDIGTAGQQAFADIKKAAEQAGGFKNLKPEEVTAKLKEMGVVGEDALKKISGAVQSATRLESLVSGVQTVEQGFSALAGAAASFGRALVPIAGVAAVVGGALVKMATSAAGAINKADAEAIKLGLSIAKFDQLKRGFEGIGISAGAISDGIAHFRAELDKLNVERVAQAFKQLEEASKAGFGGFGTQQMQLLIETAKGVGPAAEAARKALEKLGAPIPDAAKSALERLGITAKDLSVAIPQFVEKMRLLPDTAQRTADAISVLGSKLGVEFIQALRTGAVAVDAFKEKLGGMTQEQANAANKLEQDWNRLGASWTRLKTTLGATLLVNVPSNLTSTLEFINSLLKPEIWARWGAAAKQAFITVFAPIGELLAKLGELEVTIAGFVWDTISSGAQSAWSTVVSWVTQAKDAVLNFASSIASIAWDAISSAASTAWDAIKSGIDGVISKIDELASSVAGDIWSAFSSAGTAAIDAVKGAFDGLIAKIQEAISWLQQMFAKGGGGSSGAGTGTGGSPLPGMARGGLLGGRGSGTSDSNLAWVSRGEHIMPARAVAQPGVLAFLEALRRSGGDLSRVLDGLGRFALGGRGTGTSDSNLALVSRGEHIMPASVVAQPGVLALLEALRRSGGNLGRVLDGIGRFAMGGPVGMPALASGGVGGMSHVTIQFPGLPAVTGLRASSDVVEELRRSAAMAQVRSGGRKPSRYT